MADPGRLDGRETLHPGTIVAAFREHEVAYVIVGGLAAIAHGSQRLTRDFDVLIDRRRENCRRLIAALVGIDADICTPGSQRRTKLKRSADPAWIAAHNRFFDTRAGGVDVWNRAEGMPSWREASQTAVEIEALGATLLVLDRDLLIRSKLAAGRDKDLADVAELGET